MVATTPDMVAPPDRGMRYFLRSQTRWSAMVMAAGAAVLTYFFVGTIAVLDRHGWTRTCPEGTTLLECSPSDPIVSGLTSDALGLVAWSAIIAGIVTAVLGSASFKRMPNKPAREGTIAGAVLGIQATLLAGGLIWFRGADVALFARNFLNFQVVGRRAGLMWDSITGSIGSILGTAAVWGGTAAALVAAVVYLRKTSPAIIGWAAGGAGGLGLIWGVLETARVPSFVSAAKNTLILSAAGAALGFGLGLVIALFTLSRRAVVRAPARVYINFFRGTPLIWQLSFAGLAVAPALRLDISVFTIAILVLGLNLAAYSSEVYRAGIQSLERGQMEASRTLGLTYFQSMRYVVVPQAIRRVIPPLLNEFVILIKDTSLVSVLGLTLAQKELLGFARDIYSSTFNATAFLGAAAGYLIITLPLIGFVTIVERRLRSGLTSVIG